LRCSGKTMSVDTSKHLQITFPLLVASAKHDNLLYGFFVQLMLIYKLCSEARECQITACDSFHTTLRIDTFQHYTKATTAVSTKRRQQTEFTLAKDQIPLGSSRHVKTRHDTLSSPCILAYRKVLARRVSLVGQHSTTCMRQV